MMKLNLLICMLLSSFAFIGASWARADVTAPCDAADQTTVRYSCATAPGMNISIQSTMDQTTATDGDGVYACSIADPRITLENVQVVKSSISQTFSACAGNSTMTISTRTIFASVTYQGIYSSCELPNSGRLNQMGKQTAPMLCTETTSEMKKIL